ncbi:MAG: hypothetical protein ACXWQE_11420 [Bdellovibrionales bacterium]
MMKQLILILSVFGFAASAQTPGSEPANNGPSHMEETTPARAPAKKHAKKKSSKKKKKHDKNAM